MDKKSYGYYGWKEFAENRSEILNEFDRSKKINRSRPVQTAHGVAGEAVIRKWMDNFLPARYGVTSGYIIPEVIGGYKLYHYDVIIYDKINSPILWIDSDEDTSEQGKKRAIPARFVHSVFEVKATFNKKNICNSISKLCEINEFKEHFPNNFSSGIIFLELADKEANKTSLLNEFISKKTPYKFWGGIILKTDCNIEISGIIKSISKENSESHIDMKIPLVKNIDQIEYSLAIDKSSISFNEQGAGLKLFGYFGDKKSQFICKIDSSANSVTVKFPDISKVHFSKIYSLVMFNESKGIDLNWSRSNFSEFVGILLNLLDGKNIHDNESGIVFGQVFDTFE